MPGLIGIASSKISESELANCARTMRELILHEPFHRGDVLHSSPGLCASRVHIGIVQTAAQPASHNGVHIWIDGELYNQPELRARVDGETSSSDDAALFGRLCSADEALSFLKEVGTESILPS